MSRRLLIVDADTGEFVDGRATSRETLEAMARAKAKNQQISSKFAKYGNFYWLFYDIQKPLFEGNIDSATVTRLIYLATYMSYNDNKQLQFDNGNPIMRKDLEKVLGLSSTPTKYFLRQCKAHRLLAMFNPVSKQNWTYKRWFADGVEIPENTIITKSTYLDNPFLPQSYIDSLLEMKKTNPTYYRIYALGEFASLDKLVYNNWNVTIFDHSSLDGELCIGLDFGFVNDTTALVASVVNQQEKTIHIFKEWGAKGKTNDEIAEAIKALGFSKSTIIADAAEPKSVEEIRRLGISKIKPCSKGKDSILHCILIAVVRLSLC